MKIHRRYATLIPTMVVVLCLAIPPANAGGSFGIHLGNGGFGVSVGFGDWGVYTRSWSDPYWSLDFNSALAGYGEWVWVNGLGRVWRPWVSVGWRPYTYGRWVATGINWTWVAYEPWGYIPHHYGSWAYCSFGWVWQPGYSYYHANVVWTRSGSYVGWYARPPHGWSHAAHGFRHGYRHGYRDGYSDGWHDARYGTYVDWRHFGSENVSHHTVTHTMATRDRFEDNATQPSAAEVRRRGGVTIAQTQLSRRTVRLGDREVTIARPEGVAASIERNAADAVAGALAPAALERRQPLVRSRSSSTTRTSTTRGPSAHERQAKPLEVRNTPRAPSSSRSGTPAMASGSRTRDQSAAGTARPSSARSSSLGMRRPTGGQEVREVRVHRPPSNSRTNAARPSQRSERTVSAAGSAETQRSTEKPGATSVVRRTPQKPRAEARTRERKAQDADKELRRRSSGSSQR